MEMTGKQSYMAKRIKLTRRRKIELSRRDPNWKRKEKEKLRKLKAMQLNKELNGAPEGAPRHVTGLQ